MNQDIEAGNDQILIIDITYIIINSEVSQFSGKLIQRDCGFFQKLSSQDWMAL